MLSKLARKSKRNHVLDVDGRIKYIVRRDDTLLGKVAIINDFLLNDSISILNSTGHKPNIIFPESPSEEFAQCALSVTEILYFSSRWIDGGWKSEHAETPHANESLYLGFKLMILASIRRLVAEEGHSFDIRSAFIEASINAAIVNHVKQEEVSRQAIHIYNSIITKDEEATLWREDLRIMVIDYLSGWDKADYRTYDIDYRKMFKEHYSLMLSFIRPMG